MFAIIQSGGRQVKVSPGDVISVDRFEANPGDEVTIDQVLVLEKEGGEVLAGAPFVPTSRSSASSTANRGAEDSRLQEEAPQGHAPDQGSSQHLHADSNQGHRRLAAAQLATASRKLKTSWQQRRARKFTKRPRQQLPAPRREAVRRQRGHRRFDPRAAARSPLPSRPQRRPRQGRHALCARSPVASSSRITAPRAASSACTRSPTDDWRLPRLTTETDD